MIKIEKKFIEIKNNENCPNCGSASYKTKKDGATHEHTCTECGTKWTTFGHGQFDD